MRYEGKKQYYGISTEDGLIVQMEPKKDSKKDEKDNKEKETEIYNSVSGLEYFRPLFHFLRVIYCCIKR